MFATCAATPIHNDGDDDDNDETVYVTQFLALPISGKPDGEDDTSSDSGAVADYPGWDHGESA